MPRIPGDVEQLVELDNALVSYTAAFGPQEHELTFRAPSENDALQLNRELQAWPCDGRREIALRIGGTASGEARTVTMTTVDGEPFQIEDQLDGSHIPPEERGTSRYVWDPETTELPTSITYTQREDGGWTVSPPELVDFVTQDAVGRFGSHALALAIFRRQVQREREAAAQPKRRRRGDQEPGQPS